MVLIGVVVTHVVSGFLNFEAVNGVLTEYHFRRGYDRILKKPNNSPRSINLRGMLNYYYREAA